MVYPLGLEFVFKLPNFIIIIYYFRKVLNEVLGKIDGTNYDHRVF